MKTTLIALVALVLIAGGYYWYSQNMIGEEVKIEEEETQIEDNSPTQGKLDINAVCEGALAYMTFPDGESAEAFVEECKAGERPEVIERYKAEMNIGTEVAI